MNDSRHFQTESVRNGNSFVTSQPVSFPRPPLLQRGGSSALWQSVLFASQERRGHMPRTVQVPDGWLQLIRGPRPQSAKWPPFVTKLEAAMAAVGESDPTYEGLQDALKKAKAQAQVRPVADRIASSKVFWSRIDISTGKVAIQRASWPTPRHDWPPSFWRSPMAALPPTVPADFAQELAKLRVCVQQLQRENTDLRSQLQFEGQGCEERERKFVKFDTRSGTSTPQSRSRRGLHGAECAPISRIVRVICPDGDTDQQRRGQRALEPFQPIVKLTTCRSVRARARLRVCAWARRPTWAQTSHHTALRFWFGHREFGVSRTNSVAPG